MDSMGGLVKGIVSSSEILTVLLAHGAVHPNVTRERVTRHGETLFSVTAPEGTDLYGAMARWFNRESSFEAPFPEGTLLHFSIHEPVEERETCRLPRGEQCSQAAEIPSACRSCAYGDGEALIIDVVLPILREGIADAIARAMSSDVDVSLLP